DARAPSADEIARAVSEHRPAPDRRKDMRKGKIAPRRQEGGRHEGAFPRQRQAERLAVDHDEERESAIGRNSGLDPGENLLKDAHGAPASGPRVPPGAGKVSPLPAPSPVSCGCVIDASRPRFTTTSH